MRYNSGNITVKIQGYNSDLKNVFFQGIKYNILK